MAAAENLRLESSAIGELDALAFRPCARRLPGPGEVELEVAVVALNFKDVLLALGVVPTPGGQPVTFGFECVGRVCRVGGGVDGVAVGDDVVAIGSGCAGSFVTVPTPMVQRRPEPLSPAEAVTLPAVFATAEYALYELGRLRRGERVLIHAATGGVGLAAVQLAHLVGAEIYATAGSEAKRAYLHSLGVTQVSDSRSDSFVKEILDRTDGGGVDVVLNSLSGELFDRSFSVLAPHGRFVELGARDLLEGRRLSLTAFEHGASFCAVGFSTPIPDLPRRLADVMGRLGRGEISPLPLTVFPAEDVIGAFTFLARARHIGKVVLSLGEGAVAPRRQTGLENYLLPSEGVDAFERILAAGQPQVLVSTVELEARLSGARDGTATRSPGPAAVPVDRPAPSGVHLQAPADDLEAALADVWRELLGFDQVGVHDDFFELGGDSLMAVQAVHKMRKVLGAELPTHSLIEHPTIAGLVGYLGGSNGNATADAQAGRNNLVRLNAGSDGQRPIFLVHPVGGHVYFYRDLARALGPDRPVYGLQAQGVDGVSPPLVRVEDMATQYIDAIRLVQPEGPYVVGGASFGGMVAFEMAQQLLRSGEAVDLVVMIDTPGPDSRFGVFDDDAEILVYLAGHGASDDAAVEHLRRLSPDEQLRWFVSQGGAAERLAPDASLDDVRHFLRLFRSNFASLVSYEAAAFPGPVLFFRATEADAVNPSDPDRAWRHLVGGTFDVVPVPGNHITMNLPPYVDALGARLAACVEDL